jgi:hypothetical protein
MSDFLRRFNPRAWTVISIAALTLGVGGGVTAYASIPDGNGVIHGCYNKVGNLRVINTDTGQACRNAETALTWNRTGPQGPAGPSSLAVSTVTGGPAGVDPENTNRVVVSCPQGQIGIAGTWFVSHNGDAVNYPQLVTQASGPAENGVSTDWAVSVLNMGSTAMQFKALVLCVKGSES